MKKNRKIKKGLLLISQIQKIRSKNNKELDGFIKTILKLDFKTTSKILKDIVR